MGATIPAPTETATSANTLFGSSAPATTPPPAPSGVPINQTAQSTPTEDNGNVFSAQSNVLSSDNSTSKSTSSTPKPTSTKPSLPGWLQAALQKSPGTQYENPDGQIYQAVNGEITQVSGPSSTGAPSMVNLKATSTAVENPTEASAAKSSSSSPQTLLQPQTMGGPASTSSTSTNGIKGSASSSSGLAGPSLEEASSALDYSTFGTQAKFGSTTITAGYNPDGTPITYEVYTITEPGMSPIVTNTPYIKDVNHQNAAVDEAYNAVSKNYNAVKSAGTGGEVDLVSGNIYPTGYHASSSTTLANSGASSTAALSGTGSGTTSSTSTNSVTTMAPATSSNVYVQYASAHGIPTTFLQQAASAGGMEITKPEVVTIPTDPKDLLAFALNYGYDPSSLTPGQSFIMMPQGFEAGASIENARDYANALLQFASEHPESMQSTGTTATPNTSPMQTVPDWYQTLESSMNPADAVLLANVDAILNINPLTSFLPKSNPWSNPETFAQEFGSKDQTSSYSVNGQQQQSPFETASLSGVSSNEGKSSQQQQQGVESQTNPKSGMQESISDLFAKLPLQVQQSLLSTILGETPTGMPYIYNHLPSDIKSYVNDILAANQNALSSYTGLGTTFINSLLNTDIQNPVPNTSKAEPVYKFLEQIPQDFTNFINTQVFNPQGTQYIMDLANSKNPLVSTEAKLLYTLGNLGKGLTTSASKTFFNSAAGLAGASGPNPSALTTAGNVAGLLYGANPDAIANGIVTGLIFAAQGGDFQKGYDFGVKTTPLFNLSGPLGEKLGKMVPDEYNNLALAIQQAYKDGRITQGEAQAGLDYLENAGRSVIEGYGPQISRFLLRTAPESTIFGGLSGYGSYTAGERNPFKIAQSILEGYGLGTAFQGGAEALGSLIGRLQTSLADNPNVVDVRGMPQIDENGNLYYPYLERTPTGWQEARFNLGTTQKMQSAADLGKQISSAAEALGVSDAVISDALVRGYEGSPTVERFINNVKDSLRGNVPAELLDELIPQADRLSYTHVTSSDKFANKAAEGRGEVKTPKGGDVGDTFRKAFLDLNGLYNAPPTGTGELQQYNYVGIRKALADLSESQPSAESGFNFLSAQHMPYYSFEQFAKGQGIDLNAVRVQGQEIQSLLGKAKAEAATLDSPLEKDQLMQDVYKKIAQDPRFALANNAFAEYNLIGKANGYQLDSVRQSLLGNGETETVTPKGSKLVSIANYPNIAIEPNVGLFEGTSLENVLPSYRFGKNVFYVIKPPKLTVQEKDILSKLQNNIELSPNEVQTLRNMVNDQMQSINQNTQLQASSTMSTTKPSLTAELSDQLTPQELLDEFSSQGLSNSRGIARQETAVKNYFDQIMNNEPLSFEISPQQLRLFGTDIQSHLTGQPNWNLYGNEDVLHNIRQSVPANVDLGTVIRNEGAIGDELGQGAHQMYSEYLPSYRVLGTGTEPFSPDVVAELESQSSPISASSSKPLITGEEVATPSSSGATYAISEFPDLSSVASLLNSEAYSLGSGVSSPLSLSSGAEYASNPSEAASSAASSASPSSTSVSSVPYSASASYISPSVMSEPSYASSSPSSTSSSSYSGGESSPSYIENTSTKSKPLIIANEAKSSNPMVIPLEFRNLSAADVSEYSPSLAIDLFPELQNIGTSNPSNNLLGVAIRNPLPETTGPETTGLDAASSGIPTARDSALENAYLDAVAKSENVGAQPQSTSTTVAKPSSTQPIANGVITSQNTSVPATSTEPLNPASPAYYMQTPEYAGLLAKSLMQQQLQNLQADIARNYVNSLFGQDIQHTFGSTMGRQALMDLIRNQQALASHAYNNASVPKNMVAVPSEYANPYEDLRALKHKYPALANALSTTERVAFA